MLPVTNVQQSNVSDAHKTQSNLCKKLKLNDSMTFLYLKLTQTAEIHVYKHN